MFSVTEGMLVAILVESHERSRLFLVRRPAVSGNAVELAQQVLLDGFHLSRVLLAGFRVVDDGRGVILADDATRFDLHGVGRLPRLVDVLHGHVSQFWHVPLDVLAPGIGPAAVGARIDAVAAVQHLKKNSLSNLNIFINTVCPPIKAILNNDYLWNQ